MNVKHLMSVFVLFCAIVASTGIVRGQETTPKTESGASHAAHGEAEHEPDRNPMAFDPDLAIFSAIVFLILMGVLGYFAWPSIAKALDERERKITDNIASAEARLKDAQRVLSEHEAKLAAAAGEVREMLDEARRDAD